MDTMRALLEPRAVAVVGASQRPGPGARVIANLQSAGFKGGIFAVNPRYTDVLGAPCFPSVKEIPDAVDCIVAAVAADAVCAVLEDAHARGINAAIVLSAGFGEGGREDARTARLRALANKGMRICGPNCFGIVNARTGMAAFSGVVPKTLIPGTVALVSQSGSLGNFVFGPLMRDRKLGFSHFISCGNQLGATIEDYVAHLVDDPDVKVIGVIVEALQNPRKLMRAARLAQARKKSLVFVQVGKSTGGQVMIRSHTGALAGNSEILQAFLRRCGIVMARGYDEFVEMIELLAHAPFDGEIGEEVVLVSGSGGGAAVAADSLEDAGVRLSTLAPATRERLREVLPPFASVTNPIDATGVVYDDPALLPGLFDAILTQPGRPVVAASVIAAPVERMRRIAGAIAEVARTSGRTIVAYQPSPLGAVDQEIVETLHAAHVPLLMGIGNAMGAIRALHRRTPIVDVAAVDAIGEPASSAKPPAWDFLAARQALVDAGVPVVLATLASSVEEAVAAQRQFAQPVALKAEASGLLHKSDIGCVRLGCTTADEVAVSYRAIIDNARKAGFENTKVLVQPMVSGVAEAYAGIIDDPLYGPAICFGLGGIFIELLRQTVTDMAPLSEDDAMQMIQRLPAAGLLTGARGRAPGDVAALASLLVRLGAFAVAHVGLFRALDLNPIIVKPAGEGVVAVDIAVEPVETTAAGDNP
jgi:acetyltransferase